MLAVVEDAGDAVKLGIDGQARGRRDAAFERIDGVPAPEDWLIAHADFHTALLAGCANPRLRDLAASLREEAELYRRWSRPAPADPRHWTGREAYEEHRDLFDAVMARDPERADAALRHLIGLTSDMVLDTEPHA